MSLLNRNSILTGCVDSFCLVCEAHLRSDDDALLHIAKPIHRKNLDAVGFLDKFKEDHVRKVKKGYYCEYCNILMTTAAKVGPHVADENHGKNKAKNPLKREGKGVLAFNKVFIPENAWHGLIDDTCTVCDAEFDDPDIHRTGNAHVLKLVLIDIEFADENVYRKVDDSTFQCLTCNMVCAQKTMATHFDTPKHRSLYQLCCKADKSEANEPKETSNSVKDDKQIKENVISKKENVQKTLEKEKSQKLEVEKPKEQPKKELGTVMKEEVKTNPKVNGANKDKAGKADQDFCKALGAKEFVVRDITGDYWCILCDWAMDELGFLVHMKSKHHLTMLRLHQKRTEEKQIGSDKEPEEINSEEENKIKLLGAAKEFKKNNVLLNHADGLAYCRICSKNIDLEFDFIKNHIDEHKKKPAKASKVENVKPFTFGSNKSSQAKEENDSSVSPKNYSESKKEKDSSACPKNDSETKKEKNSSAGSKNDSKCIKKEKDLSAGHKNDTESKKDKNSSAGPKNDSKSKIEKDSSAGHKNDSEINKEKDSSAGPKNDFETNKEKDSSACPKNDFETNKEKDSSARPKNDFETKKEKDSSAGHKHDSETNKEKVSSACPKNDSETEKEKESNAGPKNDSESKKEDSTAAPKNDSESKKEDSSAAPKNDSETKQEKDSSASGSTASNNDLEQQILNPPPKKPKKGKERKASQSSSAAPACEEDSDIEMFSKLHDLNYNSNNNTAFCRVCVSKIPPALKSMKEHVNGASHKNKVAKVDVVPNEAPVEKKPFCEFINSFSTVENTLVKDVIINEQYCLNVMSFFLLTRHGTRLRCQACEVNLTKTMVEAHKKSPRHERAMDHASVVMSEETEFIREIRPNIFHCGFCNLLESTWRNMESHLKSTTHRECKIAAYWRVQEYTPLLMHDKGRVRMEYVVFTRMLMEQLNSNE